MKFERVNNYNTIYFTIKLFDDSTDLTKTLEVTDNFLGDLAAKYDRKNMIFMKYGTDWLIHKFNIAKKYFEKIFKEKKYPPFHKFVEDEISYPDQNKLLPAFFIIEQAFKRHLSHKYQGNFKFSQTLVR